MTPRTPAREAYFLRRKIKAVDRKIAMKARELERLKCKFVELSAIRGLWEMKLHSLKNGGGV